MPVDYLSHHTDAVLAASLNIPTILFNQTNDESSVFFYVSLTLFIQFIK